uniref:Uncharacterized protein n=1 Tax=Kwoniella pini CBS 10737 TaxID=1296096 RepID=A0A1B9I541_9TREE|nr:uncharacterized protein I206_02697 [Kwoniella pini CBS 10737]OCF50643.1 hypothetical protein I206_02697 [Kwoniella pini CBS 10737]
MSAPPDHPSHSDDSVEEDSNSIVNSASSPTQTIRQSNLGSQPAAAQTFADILKSPPPQRSGQGEDEMSSGLAVAPELRRSGSQQQQEALGKGRPASSYSDSQETLQK